MQVMKFNILRLLQLLTLACRADIQDSINSAAANGANQADGNNAAARNGAAAAGVDGFPQPVAEAAEPGVVRGARVEARVNAEETATVNQYSNLDVPGFFIVAKHTGCDVYPMADVGSQPSGFYRRVSTNFCFFI
jgi:hypothetical protein